MSAAAVPLTARGVGVDLGDARVLDGVDLDVVAGEVLALVGPNGAGKSTLLAALAGDLTPTDGRVELDGRPVAAWPARELARRRAVLLQRQGLAFGFGVRDVVAMGRAPWHRTPRAVEDGAVVDAAMGRADVLALAERLFPTLSGGEQARTSFARVLAQETPVLLLDEPTAALDIRHQEAVLAVARAAADTGCAVVVVLHDLSLAAAHADRVCVLADGRVRAVGPPSEVVRADLLEEVYQHPVAVLEHGGRPVVVPIRRVALALLLLVALVLGLPAPAQAATDVDVDNGSGAAAVDPTYLTTLQISGSGFQSIRGGHGGIYVFFGTVSGAWRPSQGGQTGRDYFYVPDSESRDNQGYQKFVAFPGSDTAGSANGGLMSADGSWSTSLAVPGAVFDAVDRDGEIRTIDCREVTCGVITVGAHGVVNARNESFTPVTVADLGRDGDADDPGVSGDEGGDEGGDEDADEGTGRDRRERGGPGKPTLEVDRPSAVAGHVMAFSASGLTPGSQASVVLDDGVAAAGPFAVGEDGGLAGVLTVPDDVGAGTHELRLFGTATTGPSPSVRFAIASADEPAEPAATPSADGDGGADAWLGPLFFAVAALVLAAVALRVLLTRWRARRRAPPPAAGATP